MSPLKSNGQLPMIVDKLFGTTTSPALAGNDQAVNLDLVLTHTIIAPGHKLPLKTKAHFLRDPDRLSCRCPAVCPG
jgi:hypothetical protein